MTGRGWIHLLVAAWALALGACSTFDRDWKGAAHRPVAKTASFSGAWDGQWTSEKHRLPSGQPAGGRLRCIFTRLDDAHYRAQFRANWLIFATGYEVTFDTKRRGRALAFRGEHDLGTIFGGVYRYDGLVTPEHFSSSFASRYDHGRFEMQRPSPDSLKAPRQSAAAH